MSKVISSLMKSMPELESLLYDLDLMPEQVKTDKEVNMMVSVAKHMESLMNRIKKESISKEI